MRQATIAQINDAVNRPKTLRALTSETDAFLDLSNFYAANAGNMALQADEGVMLFCPTGDVYECHACFYPEFSGKRVMQAAHEMLYRVFTRRKPVAIVCWPPRENRAARHMSYLIGFRPSGRVAKDTLGREVLEYRLERERWETF